MRDPHIHVEKTPMPGFGHGAMRDLISSATGLVGSMPKTVGTGCGKRRPLVMTSQAPAKVTCLPCREYARAEHIKWAEMSESVLSSFTEITEEERATIRENAINHRTLAAQYK